MTDPQARVRYRQAYAKRWGSPPPEQFPGHLFFLDVENASAVAWDIERGEMILQRWDAGRGLAESRRRYP